MPESITVLGTTHNTEESIRRVERAIHDYEPDVVAVELPPETFKEGPEWSIRAALDPRAPVTVPGLVLHRFALDGDLWQVDEMFVAAQTAADVDARIALIDRPLTESLDRNGRALSHDLFDLLRKLRREVSVHRTQLTAGNGRELLERDLWTVGDVATECLDYLRALRRHGATDPFDPQQRELATERMSPDEAVSFIDALRAILPRWIESHIDERDACMAGHLRWLADEEVNILAVIAKGHVPGVVELLDGRRELDDTLIRKPTYVDAARVSDDAY